MKILKRYLIPKNNCEIISASIGITITIIAMPMFYLVLMKKELIRGDIFGMAFDILFWLFPNSLNLLVPNIISGDIIVDALFRVPVIGMLNYTVYLLIGRLITSVKFLTRFILIALYFAISYIIGKLIIMRMLESLW